MAPQESAILLEASDCHAAAGVPPAAQYRVRFCSCPCSLCVCRLLRLLSDMLRGAVTSATRDARCLRAALIPAHPRLQPCARTAQGVLRRVRDAACCNCIAPSDTARCRTVRLPSKVSKDKEGKLVLMCYSDVGCVRARQALLCAD